jgi:hypothetical protein
MIVAIGQFGLHQVEQIADPFHESQLLGREPDVKLAFDSHHQSNQVDRVEPERLSKVLIVLRKLKRLTHLLFEQGQELRA